jgi:hypothetical protein
MVHTEGEVRISSLKSDDAVVLLDTSTQAADYYLPKLNETNDGFHLRIIRQGQFTATLYAPDGTLIEDNPTYVLTEDGTAIEVTYIHQLSKWVVISAGLYVIEYYPPTTAASYQMPTSPTGESSFAPPPPPVTTEGRSRDKTFVFPTEGEIPEYPATPPYYKDTARVEAKPYPDEGGAGVSPPLPAYSAERTTLNPLNDFIEEPEVP